VVSTERKISQPAEQVKETTTVAMDFGRITIDQDLVLYLFGTPGQRRFDFMWEILSEGMLGFVVMVDSCKPETFREARMIWKRFVLMLLLRMLLQPTNRIWKMPGDRRLTDCLAP